MKLLLIDNKQLKTNIILHQMFRRFPVFYDSEQESV